jgi:LysM repeat protein
VRRLGLVALALLMSGVTVGAAACGGDDAAEQTLPPIATTTSTTSSTTTTTTWVPFTYEIQSGDSLQAIADQFGVDIDKLAILNGITDPDAIEAGDELEIPPPSAPSTTVATTGT